MQTKKHATSIDEQLAKTVRHSVIACKLYIVKKLGYQYSSFSYIIIFDDLRQPVCGLIAYGYKRHKRRTCFIFRTLQKSFETQESFIPGFVA